VAAPDNLAGGVDSLLHPILRQPQYALSLAKRAVYAGGSGSIQEGMKAESEQFSHCFEHTFFKDLMRRQLRDGTLETTADVSRLTGDKKA
jgi:enoyl-CoA hydratase/carnithine racemase